MFWIVKVTTKEDVPVIAEFPIDRDAMTTYNQFVAANVHKVELLRCESIRKHVPLKLMVAPKMAGVDFTKGNIITDDLTDKEFKQEYECTFKDIDDEGAD